MPCPKSGFIKNGNKAVILSCVVMTRMRNLLFLNITNWIAARYVLSSGKPISVWTNLINYYDAGFCHLNPGAPNCPLGKPEACERY